MTSGRNITSFYGADHDRLDELMKQFKKYKHVDFERAGKFFSEFKSGLERHIVWEEEILFPLFEEKTGMQGAGPTEVMRSEHVQIKAVLGKIQDRIAAGDAGSDAEEDLLISVLTAHNGKEEQILYPLIDSLCGPEEREVVFRKMSEPVSGGSHSGCCGH
ncbi:MAG: hemerythrin domain-containing protein [Candidatus Omnitrophica bacterium]|nr:hemerythrin domain-containing protein [Candidatus Omnitrophota bacterium]